MHIKFLDHGTGSGKKAAEYLTGDIDHNGIVRTEVKVLRGSPELVGKVADSLSFKQKYTSGVIAWAPSDNPTDAQISEVLNDFEKLAFAGMSPDRFSHSAILHREENGGCHVHIFVARVDLLTGKSFNIAPPGWQKNFDSLRDKFNLEHGWARPDDPTRSRLIQPKYSALVDASNLRAGLKVEPDSRQLITKYLTQRIAVGIVTDRPSLLASLSDAGFSINREGNDYVSIKDSETGVKLRLKGAIYEREFDAKKFSQQAENADGAGNENANRASSEVAKTLDESNKSLLEQSRANFEKAISRLAEYNQARYQSAPEKFGKNDLVAVDSDDSSLLVGDIPDLALFAEPDVQPANRRDENERRSIIPSNHESSMDDVWSKPLQKNGELKNENRDGNDVDASIREIEQRVDKARERADHSFAELRKALDQHEQANSQLGKSVEDIKMGAGEMIKNNSDELEIFKSQLSLTEYAQAFGYSIVKNKSSKNSHFLEDGGGDKIIVARGKDGHDIYCSTKDVNDSGSIIDFVQHRQKLNLGQVRKELRPWAGLKGPRVESIKRRKPVNERLERPLPLEKDRIKLLQNYHQLTEYNGKYLSQQRGLSADTLKAFAGEVKQDKKGNTVFVHKDGDGEVTGWEAKNAGFTGFSSGGEKSLFRCQPDAGEVKRVIVCESSIDAMSYHQLKGREGDLYVSFGGGMSSAQEEQLKGLLAGLPRASVLVATDRDQQGDKYAETIKGWKPSAIRDLPAKKDWNEDLLSEKEKSRVENRDAESLRMR